MAAPADLIVLSPDTVRMDPASRTATFNLTLTTEANTLAAFMASHEDHGYWRILWPEPRERFRWCRWMLRADESDLVTSPPFVLDGERRQRRITAYGKGSVLGAYAILTGNQDVLFEAL